MIGQLEKEPVSAPVAPWRLQRCFSTLGCPEWTLEQVATTALCYGVDGVELRTLEGRIDLPDYLEKFPGGWMGVKNYLQATGVSVRVLGTSFKLVGGDARQQEELMLFAALAEALGVPYLRVFGGGVWGQALSEEDYRSAARVVEKWENLRRARKWKVRMLMETHDAFSASAPCLKLMKVLSGPVELIWDSHHTWRLGGEAPAQTWAALQAHVRHVHVKDSIGKPSARHPFTYVLPGQGEMPLGELAEVLKRDNFDGSVSLEWEKMWHPYLPPLPEALRAMADLTWW